jgi:amino acid adenylation domain-containing protein
MLVQADLDAVLVDDESLPQLAEVLDGVPNRPPVLLPNSPAGALRQALSMRVFDRDDLTSAAPLVSLPDVEPGDLAYLLFTSGSTGQPKGVPITHANVRAFLNHNVERYGLTSDDRLSQTFDQTFDLSVFDLFMAWESGACVCSMQPIELLAPFRYLEENNVTLWFSVPSIAALLLKRGALTPARMPTLRWSLFCGEGLPSTTAEAWQAAAPNSTVENLYGPTELTIACAAYRWNPVTSPAECVQDLVPIGDVYPGLSPIVIDDTLRDVPDGELGELCVAGPQTSPGYWQAPHLTAERFFERNGRRYYRTGDLVRRERGRFVYLGRNDQQVKIGGYRIELGDVEAALRRAGCVDAVALAWPNERQADTIVAIVSGTENASEIGVVAGQHLPSYMLPRSIHVLDELPLNGNGKIDRKALRHWLSGRLAAA